MKKECMCVHEKDLNGKETTTKKKLPIRLINMHVEKIKIISTKAKNLLDFEILHYLVCWHWHQTFLIFLKIN